MNPREHVPTNHSPGEENQQGENVTPGQGRLIRDGEGRSPDHQHQYQELRHHGNQTLDFRRAQFLECHLTKRCQGNCFTERKVFLKSSKTTILATFLHS